jgi:succinate dehydrogenase / fumarate reductase cytochrome b subunit
MNAPPLEPHFALRKLHSLLGLLPIGAFVAFHLFENSLAVKGKGYFTEHVIHKIGNMPYVELMEVFVIALPILFHGLYGLWIWWTGRSNVSSYGYARNWMYVLQRISGGVALVFILVHVYQTRFQVLIGALSKDELYDKMVALFSNPLMQAWYAVGLAACVFHLANGIWLFLVSWGITIGPRSQRISTLVTTGIGLVVLLLGVRALFGFDPTTI